VFAAAASSAAAQLYALYMYCYIYQTKTSGVHLRGRLKPVVEDLSSH
jgi:hypothetical protein